MVFYNTGHTETRENKAPRVQLQLDTRGSRATEEEGRTKARITMKKWKNRKIRDFLAHRFTGIFYLQAIECNLHGNSSCCTGRRPDECFVATPPLLLLTPNSIRIYQGLFLLYNFYPRTQPCTDKIPGSSRLYTGHNQCFECSFFRLVLCVNVNSDCGTFHVLTSF